MDLTFAVIGLQLLSGFVNTMRQCRVASRSSSALQDFELDTTKRAINIAEEEFVQTTRLQREIEHRINIDRIEQIQSSFNNSIELLAYSGALENFPLLVPPFIMKRETIPMLYGYVNEKSDNSIPFHCILTNCTDSSFNAKIFKELEENLSQYLCKYWNVASNHPVIFYQNAWRDTTKDARRYLSNLRYELASIPTIVISPIVDEEGLWFLCNIWGITPGDNNGYIEKTIKPQLSIDIKPNMSYSNDDCQLIINELSSLLSTFVSYVADQYFWLYYGTPPLYLKILHNNVELASNSDLGNIVKDYCTTLEKGEEWSENRYNISGKSVHDRLVYLNAIKECVGSNKTEELLINILKSTTVDNGIYDDSKNTLPELVAQNNIFSNLDTADIAIFKEIKSFIK